MRSLPVIDNQTDRIETMAFACLGFVSVVLIAFAALNGGKFAAGKDDIVASLKKQATPVASAAGNRAPITAANGNTAAKSGLAAPQQ